LKSNPLSKSETAKTLETISAQWKMDLPKTKTLMVHEIEDNASIIIGEGLSVIKFGELSTLFI